MLFRSQASSSSRRSRGRGQARRETPDPVAEIGYRHVEAGGIAGRDRVRDGPVHRGLAAQFLACHIADRHHQVILVLDLAGVAGPQPGQREAVAAVNATAPRTNRYQSWDQRIAASAVAVANTAAMAR